MSIRVKFLDTSSCVIPLADLVSVCRVGSDHAIEVPVASKRIFDYLKAYINKHESEAQTPGWKLDILEWDETFMEQFTSRDLLDQLAEVADLTQQRELEKLCDVRKRELIIADHGGEDDEEDHGGEDEEEYYDYNMEKLPSPKDQKDEDEFWAEYCQEDDEDRESPSP